MGSYETTWSNATELGNIVSTLDKANVDFSDGAGLDENGKHLTSGKDIKMHVKISNWNENIAMAKSH